MDGCADGIQYTVRGRMDKRGFFARLLTMTRRAKHRQVTNRFIYQSPT